MPTVHCTVTVLFRSVTGGQFSMSFHGADAAEAEANFAHFLAQSALKPILVGRPV